MAESIVSSVAERLGDLLIQEAKFLQGVSEQVEQMQIELELMQGYLEDADKRQVKDNRIRTWVSKIREAAYDVEDVIDTFAVKIASRRRGGIQSAFKRYACIINEAAELHKVGSQIEAIKTKISNLTRCLETYGIKHIREGEGSSSWQWRQSYPHVEEDTVGLDKDAHELVAKLVNEDGNCQVVSICGMGGLGKTTLAKKVYRHEDIKRHFDSFAWAFISQQCQPRNVWEGILFQLISPSKEQRDEILKYKDAELAQKLCEVQKEKKCLVILDDIWRTKDWDGLKAAFSIGEAGSKILLTTRNKDVALYVDSRGYLHEPQCLTQEEGWELLLKKALMARKDDPDFRIDKDMKELGLKMVERCKGLPLAVVVLGGILATKYTMNEWKMVYENIKSYLRRGKGHGQQQSEVYEVLALSYHELPYQLKPCFLYLGHFPEDFNIPTKKLIRMWVAEGIVSPMHYEVEGAETLEDVAECYLGELLDRNMVQVGERGSTGRIKTCRLHDLMRDLCLSKSNEENFLKIVHIQGGNEQMGSLSLTENIAKPSHRFRRLAIYSSEFTFSWEHEKTPFLRSLLFFGTHKYRTRISQKMKSWFMDFRLLKILDLEEFGIWGKLPKAIGNLIHLRYLNLYFHTSTNLPSSIGNLRCLQTLIMDSNNEIKVPNVIWKMERLRHLYLPDTMKESSDKLRLGNLSELQTLQRFDVEIFDVKELSRLTNLKKLGISWLNSFKELKGILISPGVPFNRLCSLTIREVGPTMEGIDLGRLLSGYHLYKLVLQGKTEKLPEYPQFPPNLAKLTLIDSRLEEDPMPTLEKLPNLSFLHLRLNSFSGKEMKCSSNGFPQLKSLYLVKLRNLEEWRVDEGAMPNLSKLQIGECWSLKKVPDGLRFITTLRELVIRGMSEAFKNRLKEGGEDSSTVQHVPSIFIQ